MKIRKKKKNKRSAIMLSSADAYDILCSDGYTSLDKNPEIMTACRRIAELIGMITIHIMSNTERGDVRIVNELSRKIDINPCSTMTRKTFIEAVVMNLLLYGRGNSVVQPHTSNGYLEDLIPIEASRVSFMGDTNAYTIMIDGVPYTSDDVLHFVYNPNPHYLYKGQGITTQLKDVANNLKQAQTTINGFLKSKWKPSLIIKVDGLVDEFSNKSGRRKLIEEYVESGEAGAPWLLPADQFQVEQVKPLSLADLAISDTVELDKRTVASIIGVPAFLLGIDKYNAEEWNNFVNTTVKSIVIGLQQELTKKLIYSPDMYIRFNVMSLLDWDIETISSVFGSLSDRGFVTGNEVRDKLGMSPKEGLDELRVLENYIPYEMSGNQKKLYKEDEK